MTGTLRAVRAHIYVCVACLQRQRETNLRGGASGPKQTITTETLSDVCIRSAASTCATQRDLRLNADYLSTLS